MRHNRHPLVTQQHTHSIKKVKLNNTIQIVIAFPNKNVCCRNSNGLLEAKVEPTRYSAHTDGVLAGCVQNRILHTSAGYNVGCRLVPSLRGIIPLNSRQCSSGPQNFNKPSHIFITHTHGDHVASLPFTMIGDENSFHQFQIYAPAEAERHLKKYIAALFEVNSLTDECDMPVVEWYRFFGCTESSKFRLTLNKAPYEIDVVLCDHGVPTVSYCFSAVKNKLKEEYVGISGKELAELKKNGAEITKEVVTPTFAFVCDSSIAVLARYPSILSYPVVIIECTFLYPEELENAALTKHIHWEELKPYVLDHPSTLFILIHFSLRYKDEEILEFFVQQDDIPNIKVWAGEVSPPTCSPCL